ncbi:MAG: hypothetical protein ACQEUT_16145 [Bacillota bacterium]
MKKELWYIEDKVIYNYTLIGFNELNGYGEVHIRSKSETVYIFRGYARRKVLREARKQMGSLSYKPGDVKKMILPVKK